MTDLDALFVGWLWQHDAIRDDLVARHEAHKAALEASGARTSAFLARFAPDADSGLVSVGGE